MTTPEERALARRVLVLEHRIQEMDKAAPDRHWCPVCAVRLSDAVRRGRHCLTCGALTVLTDRMGLRSLRAAAEGR